MRKKRSTKEILEMLIEKKKQALKYLVKGIQKANHEKNSLLMIYLLLLSGIKDERERQITAFGFIEAGADAKTIYKAVKFLSFNSNN